ncbi:MAG: hypothetical protein WB615_10715 [Candidatus Tumulicola sp.]
MQMFGGGERPWREARLMAIEPDSGSPASARPTGTVTFVFTDIEGSTNAGIATGQ